MKRLLPEHIKGYTARTWRSRFSTKLKVLEWALNDLRKGCAYSPILKNVEAIEREVMDAKEKLRGNWKP